MKVQSPKSCDSSASLASTTWHWILGWEKKYTLIKELIGLFPYLILQTHWEGTSSLLLIAIFGPRQRGSHKARGLERGALPGAGNGAQHLVFDQSDFFTQPKIPPGEQPLLVKVSQWQSLHKTAWRIHKNVWDRTSTHSDPKWHLKCPKIQEEHGEILHVVMLLLFTFPSPNMSAPSLKGICNCICNEFLSACWI